MCSSLVKLQAFCKGYKCYKHMKEGGFARKRSSAKICSALIVFSTVVKIIEKCL